MLVIDKLVHHDEVVLSLTARIWGNVTCSDSHSCDSSIVVYNAEERQTAIARCGRNKTAEQRFAVGVEKLHASAGALFAVFLDWATLIGLRNLSKDSAKASNCCSSISLSAG